MTSDLIEVGYAAGAGQLIDVGGDSLQDRGHPGGRPTITSARSG